MTKNNDLVGSEENTIKIEDVERIIRKKIDYYHRMANFFDEMYLETHNPKYRIKEKDQIQKAGLLYITLDDIKKFARNPKIFLTAEMKGRALMNHEEFCQEIHTKYFCFEDKNLEIYDCLTFYEYRFLKLINKGFYRK